MPVRASPGRRSDDLGMESLKRNALNVYHVGHQFVFTCVGDSDEAWEAYSGSLLRLNLNSMLKLFFMY